MVLDVEAYWRWAAASASAERDRRIQAESTATVHVDALELIRQSPDQAISTLVAIIDWPADFTEWHAQTIAFGIADEAVHCYGKQLLAASNALAGPRGSMVAGLL